MYLAVGKHDSRLGRVFDGELCLAAFASYATDRSRHVIAFQGSHFEFESRKKKHFY
jgi:hypothetical protein